MDIIKKAQIALLQGNVPGGRFVAEFLTSCRRLEGTNVLPPNALMAVTMKNGRPLLLTDCTRLEGMTIQDVSHGLIHEFMHILLEHGARRGGRNHSKWNIAGDLAINCQIPGMRIGLIPGQGECAHIPTGRTADEYYDMLPDMDGDGCGSTSAKEAMTDFDRAVIKEAVRQAATSTKGQGIIPEAMQIAIDKFLGEGTVDWRAVLRRILAASVKAGSRSTWLRPNRKKLPLQGRLKSYTAKIAIAIDTSGSIACDEELLAMFFSEINSLMRIYKAEVQVIECDAAVGATYKLKPGQKMKPQVTGGGGTSFVPPYEWLREHRQRPDVLIYLTDLMGTFPDRQYIRTIWAVPEQFTNVDIVPFGKVISIKKEG